jgi:hypothetical protein
MVSDFSRLFTLSFDLVVGDCSFISPVLGFYHVPLFLHHHHLIRGVLIVRALSWSLYPATVVPLFLSTLTHDRSRLKLSNFLDSDLQLLLYSGRRS